jgi:hypothetical protein
MDELEVLPHFYKKPPILTKGGTFTYGKTMESHPCLIGRGYFIVFIIYKRARASMAMLNNQRVNNGDLTMNNGSYP